jgi:CHAD domain-containing protein
MSYLLDLALPTPDALRAAAREQIEDAIRLLDQEHAGDPVEAVHGARKDLKKTRSILRLARPDMPTKAYRRENRFLRETARSLSATRDADVMVETLDDLSERYAGQLAKDVFSALRAGLAEDAERQRRQTQGADAEVVGDALRSALARVEDWPLEKCDEDTLRDGIVRAYARGRRAFAEAGREPTVVHLHDWRKRVKDLWYHQRLIEDAWPGLLEAHADESHRLADLLGDDHDLAVLAEALPGEDSVLELIGRRREELQADARRLGERIYAEKPKAFRRRLGSYLEAERPKAVVAHPA